MAMIRLRLHRLVAMPHNPHSNHQFVGPLLEDAHFTQHVNDYLMDRFGQDGNGGITNALQYVVEKYGGGRYIICFEQILTGSSLPVTLKSYHFELAGPSKDLAPTEPYFSPFTGKWE